jgi:predicted enzyme related to lactoylglutathione lyase
MLTMDDRFAAQVPPHWLPYFAVEDVDTTVAAAARAGASVQTKPISVPDGPRIAVLKDPQGAVFGVYTEGPEAED